MFAERMERLRVRLAEAEPLMPKSSKVTDTNILSVLEKSQLVFGDKTILQPGMVLAVMALSV